MISVRFDDVTHFVDREVAAKETDEVASQARATMRDRIRFHEARRRDVPGIGLQRNLVLEQRAWLGAA